MALASDGSLFGQLEEDVPDAVLEGPEHSVLSKIDILGSDSWSPNDKQGAWKLLHEFVNVFSKDDPNLGRTLLVKHELKLKPNSNLFKEQYRKMPPGVYEEVQVPLQEMLAIGAIHPPILMFWALTVILVQKKDSKLRFCTGYWKLNEMTIKDAYSIPRI